MEFANLTKYGHKPYIVFMICVFNNFLGVYLFGEENPVGKQEMETFSQLYNFQSKSIQIFHHSYYMETQVIILLTLKKLTIIIAHNVLMYFFYI